MLPRAVVTDPAQANGAVAATRIAAGSPLRADLLKRPAAVRNSQTVSVTIEGEAFQISSEGKVMNDAPTGGSVQVRLKNQWSPGWCAAAIPWYCSNRRGKATGRAAGYAAQRRDGVRQCGLAMPMRQGGPKVCGRASDMHVEPSKEQS